MDLVDLKAYLHFFMARVYLCRSNPQFSFTCYYPPGQLPGQVQPFGPGGGELLEGVLSRGCRVDGANENIFSLILRSA